MFKFLKRQEGNILFVVTSRIIVFCLSFSLVLGPSSVHAQSINFFNLPVPGTMVPLSTGYMPALMQGIIVDPTNPLRLDFIVDTGDTDLKGEALKDESLKMVKYFYAALTVPEEER